MILFAVAYLVGHMFLFLIIEQFLISSVSFILHSMDSMLLFKFSSEEMNRIPMERPSERS